MILTNNFLRLEVQSLNAPIYLAPKEGWMSLGTCCGPLALVKETNQFIWIFHIRALKQSRFSSVVLFGG